jgi:hypothetical protein
LVQVANPAPPAPIPTKHSAPTKLMPVKLMPVREAPGKPV